MKPATPRRPAPVAPPDPAWHDRPGWKSVKAVLEVFGILGGVVGVAMVAYQLWDAEQTKRIERSLALVERFNNDSLLNATETLRRATLDMNEQLALVGNNAGFDDAMTKQVAIALTASSNPETRANQSALVEVARFFDETSLCVASGLCDRQIVCLYLTPFAVEVNASLHAGLEAVNARSGGKVGDGLAKVALFPPCAR